MEKHLNKSKYNLVNCFIFTLVQLPLPDILHKSDTGQACRRIANKTSNDYNGKIAAYGAVHDRRDNLVHQRSGPTDEWRKIVAQVVDTERALDQN